jgi:hypothetical protein
MHTQYVQYDNKFVINLLIDKQSSLYFTFIDEDDQDNYDYQSCHSIQSSTVVQFK